MKSREQTSEMKYFANHCVTELDYHPCRQEQRAGVSILKLLWNYGCRQRWELINIGPGLPSTYRANVLRTLMDHGYIAANGVLAYYLTDKGLELGDSLGFRGRIVS